MEKCNRDPWKWATQKKRYGCNQRNYSKKCHWAIVQMV